MLVEKLGWEKMFCSQDVWEAPNEHGYPVEEKNMEDENFWEIKLVRKLLCVKGHCFLLYKHLLPACAGINWIWSSFSHCGWIFFFVGFKFNMFATGEKVPQKPVSWNKYIGFLSAFSFQEAV